MNSLYHFSILEKFRENYSTWFFDDHEPKKCSFWVHNKTRMTSSEFTVSCTDILQIVCYSLFSSILSNFITHNHMLETNFYSFVADVPDPDDIEEELYNEDQEDSTKQTFQNLKSEMNDPQSLDQMILRSLGQVKDEDL